MRVREVKEEDDSVEHVKQIRPSVVAHRSHPRRLRFTYEPTDLSEIAVEHTTISGEPVKDSRNIALLLESVDLVWLDKVIHPIAEKIRGAPPASQTRVSLSKSVNGMSVTLGDIANRRK